MLTDYHLIEEIEEFIELYEEGGALYAIVQDDGWRRVECLEPCDADPLAVLED